ncbi:hypothetical protein PFISCL1PPCAC_6789, partial [Pristionchus fissidentatus]
ISLLLLPLLTVGVASAKCVDGENNRMKLYDLYDGKKDVAFEDFEILTYDNLKRPTCNDKGKGSIVLPGHFQLLSGKVRVKKTIPITGAAHLGFNLEKNSYMIGTVCKNGQSNNAFVPDEFCHVDVFSIVHPKVLKKFQHEGVYDIFDIPGDWREMKPMPTQDNPYIEGEWKVSATVNMAGSAIAGMKVGDGWIEVATKDAAKEEL